MAAVALLGTFYGCWVSIFSSMRAPYVPSRETLLTTSAWSLAFKYRRSKSQAELAQERRATTGEMLVEGWHGKNWDVSELWARGRLEDAAVSPCRHPLCGFGHKTRMQMHSAILCHSMTFLDPSQRKGAYLSTSLYR